MIPILYDINETAFVSNGLGRLRDATRVEVTEERNGVYECEFEYPVTGAHYEDIICGRIIGVRHDETNDIQPFEIYSYSKPIDGVTTFHAFHISYKQSKLTVSGGAINDINDAFALIKNNAVPSNPFTYWTDIQSTAYMSGAEGTPKTVRQLLGGVEGSVLDAYGGEYEWDKWTVRLWQQRGQVRDFTIRYGLNLLDYQNDTDYSDTYNAVIPFWSGQDVNGNDIVVKGSMISSGIMYDNSTSCVPLDLTEKFESQPTTANLETMARAYLSANQPTLPSQTIKVDFIRLQDSEEYTQYAALQNCNLCDSVRVVFPRYGMDGYFKIVKTVYDVLLERYTEMELGTLSTSLASAIGDTGSGSSTPNQPSGVIESGTDGIWTWRKWADGTSECWGKDSSRSASITSQWGGAYYGSVISNSFPTDLFIVAPMIQINLMGGDGCFAGINTATSSAFSYYPYCPKSGTHSFIPNLYVVGRWK